MEHPALVETRAWVQRAVIGLNLCPFAKAPQAKGQVRYVLCEAADEAALLQALVDELALLARTPEDEVETTLLVHPQVLQDFASFNDFLDPAEDALAELDLEGVIQLASFHPQYQFAGTAADDIGNATNRSPYPTLHLIRESSIERAVAGGDPSERIVQANLATLERLGHSGWNALRRQCQDDALPGAGPTKP